MFTVINNIVRLKFPEKLFIIYLFCFLFGLIPTVNALIGEYVNEIIQFPQFTIGENDEGVTLGCPTNQFSESVVYGTFASQTGAFIPILGLLFTVAVYGTTSVFGYVTTCLLDDIVILTSSLAPILSWYTFVKPIWLSILINEMRNPTSLDNVDKDSDKISLFLAGSFVIILILMAIFRIYFSKCHTHAAKNSFISRLKTFIIWLYFFHSLEVITFSFLEYKFVFSEILNTMEKIRKGNNTPSTNRLGTTINLLFLNWFVNVCYLLTSFGSVVTYHFPNLESEIFKIFHPSNPSSNSENENFSASARNYQGFIRKKTFFFTVTLSIGHIFFEYDWFCTPPFISIVFNTIITTVLTRSITSFFSNSGVIKIIHKHGDKDSVYARIQSKDIEKVKHFYKKDKNGKLKRYRVGSARGYVYACREEDDEYFYVMFTDESVYFINLGKIEKGKILDKTKTFMGVKMGCLYHGCKKIEKDEILNKIKTFMGVKMGCLYHGCEKIEQEEQSIINKHVKEKEENKITEIIEQKLGINEHLMHLKEEEEEEKHKITEIKGRVLVNVLETGFLSYIIYSHRGSEKEEKSKTLLYIIIIFTIVSTLCVLCALYALLIFYDDLRIISGIIICALFALFGLFLLSKFFQSVDKGLESKS